MTILPQVKNKNTPDVDRGVSALKLFVELDRGGNP
jgi:hypothetical protein